MASILIADDDPTSRAVLREILKSGGHTVTEASDGAKALAMFTADPTDLVFVDIFMPDKEGIETIMELRGLKPGVKTVAVSGGGSTDTSLKCLEWARACGASATLAKPFDRENVLTTVRVLLEK